MLAKGIFPEPLTSRTTARGEITLHLTIKCNYPAYTVTATDILPKNTRSRIYNCTIQDDLLMQVPDDLHQATINMLVGIGQRLAQLHEFGFEREP